MKIPALLTKLYIFSFLAAFLNFSYLLGSASPTDEEPLERQWKASLNLNLEDKLIDMNDWYLRNLGAISKETQGKIQQTFKQPGSPNIAKLRFSLWYRTDSSINLETLEDDTIYLSGLRQPPEKLEVEFAVLNSRMIDEQVKKMEGAQLNAYLLKELAGLMGREEAYIKEGNHAEAIGIIITARYFPKFLEQIYKKVGSDQFTIIGTSNSFFSNI